MLDLDPQTIYLDLGKEKDKEKGTDKGKGRRERGEGIVQREGRLGKGKGGKGRVKGREELPHKAEGDTPHLEPIHRAHGLGFFSVSRTPEPKTYC